MRKNGFLFEIILKYLNMHEKKLLQKMWVCDKCFFFRAVPSTFFYTLLDYTSCFFPNLTHFIWDGNAIKSTHVELPFLTFIAKVNYNVSKKN